MNDIVKQNGGANLPANFLEKMAAGIAESRRTSTFLRIGKPLMVMSKVGVWGFGPGREPVQEGSRWVANPMSPKHGFCCWKREPNGTAALAGEVMVSMMEPKPDKPDPVTGTPYEAQFSIDLKCLDGADRGTEVMYKTNSYGGCNAFEGLLTTMQEHWLIDPAHPCPVLVLGSYSYPNKKYGGDTFNPILTVVGWVGMDGVGDVGETAVQPKPEPAAAKMAKPKKPPLNVVESGYTLDPEPAPAPTQRAHQGQRRRPGT
jgi:hypothetical protein